MFFGAGNFIGGLVGGYVAGCVSGWLVTRFAFVSKQKSRFLKLLTGGYGGSAEHLHGVAQAALMVRARKDASHADELRAAYETQQQVAAASQARLVAALAAGPPPNAGQGEIEEVEAQLPPAPAARGRGSWFASWFGMA